MVELQPFKGIDRTCRATENYALGLFAGESFLGALADEVALDFGGETERESENFAGDVIAETVVVLDRPDAAATHHADIENLHDHEQVTAETRKLRTDDEIAASHLFEKLAEAPDGPILGAAYCLLDPAVYGDALSSTEPENLETLILDSLLVAAYSDVSIIHNTHPISSAQCRMHQQVQSH